MLVRTSNIEGNWAEFYSVKMPNFRAFSRFEMYMDDIAVIISHSTTKIVLKNF